MPRRPPAPCPAPGCPALVAGGGGCERHRYRRLPRAERPQARFYSTAAWRRLRQHVLAAHPLCGDCATAGRTTAATEVDHVVPISRGGAALDEANCRSLCKRCHSRRTAASGLRWGRGE